MGQQIAVEIASLECNLQRAWISIGVWIHNERMGKEITLRDLARRAGIDHGHLSHIESGTKRTTVLRLERIISALQPRSLDLPDDRDLLPFVDTAERAMQSMGVSLDDFPPTKRKEFVALTMALRLDAGDQLIGDVEHCTCGFAARIADLEQFKRDWDVHDGNSPGYNRDKAAKYGRQGSEYRELLGAANDRIAELEAKNAKLQEKADALDREMESQAF
jgi:transcriptional regulator with XRE-family HTH domain